MLQKVRDSETFVIAEFHILRHILNPKQFNKFSVNDNIWDQNPRCEVHADFFQTITLEMKNQNTHEQMESAIQIP